MSNCLDLLQKCKSSIEITTKANFPTEWEIKRIEECLEGLFTFAKFKTGDKVKMAATYPINQENSWGWMSYRHLFKAGSKAVIVKVDWYNNTFMYTIEFDKKSWIDDKDNVHTSDTTTQFVLSEKWLKASK